MSNYNDWKRIDRAEILQFAGTGVISIATLLLVGVGLDMGNGYLSNDGGMVGVFSGGLWAAGIIMLNKAANTLK